MAKMRVFSMRCLAWGWGMALACLGLILLVRGAPAVTDLGNRLIEDPKALGSLDMVREQAQLLSQRKQAERKPVDELLEDLGNANWKVRYAASLQLGERGTPVRQVLEELTALLKDPNARVHHSAQQSLEKLSKASQEQPREAAHTDSGTMAVANGTWSCGNCSPRYVRPYDWFYWVYYKNQFFGEVRAGTEGACQYLRDRDSRC